MSYSMANSRVLGVKIAQRLFECFTPNQRDERIHIILVCRSQAKAEAPIVGLRKLFPGRKPLLEFQGVDLSIMRSVESFCGHILERFVPL